MKKLSTILIVLSSILVGALAIWAVQRDEPREFNDLKEKALCVLELPAGTPSAGAMFTTSRTLEELHVGLRPGQNGEVFSVSVSGSQGLMCCVTTEATHNAWSREIPAGTYEVTVVQKTGSHGALVVIAAEPPRYVTGWQILSRAYLGFLILSAVWTMAARKSKNARRRNLSLYVFQMLLLGFLVVFLYLFCHEGGHCLAEIIYGRYDFARSDMWGIHGSPHSGGKPGPPLQGWQYALISGAGPMCPTLAGWVLFLLGSLRFGRNLRNAYPLVNLYFSAVVAILVFPLFALAGCLLGLMSDGDWHGFITNVPGPLWLIHGLVWGVLLANAILLWRVVPELWRSWKGQFLKLQTSTAS